MLITEFASDDHRAFNRQGEAFDKGETFSGVDYQVALEVVAQLKAQLPAGVTLAQTALKWILMHDAVSCAIPGAKTREQVIANVSASDLPEIEPAYMALVEKQYRMHIHPTVHHVW